MNRSAPEAKSPQLQPAAMDPFIQALNQVFLDATTLEVSTMVVDAIDGQRFIPQEVYQDLYYLREDTLSQQHYSPDLQAAYGNLRSQLARQYHALLREPTHPLYHGENSGPLPPLPNPTGDAQDQRQIQNLLGDRQFLCCLRKLGELKIALDQRKRQHQQAKQPLPEGIIYAKTILQLDGTIANTYTEALMSHPHCTTVLQAHQHNIQTSEQQWQGLLRFFISLIQGTFKRQPKPSSQTSKARPSLPRAPLAKPQ
ncbi:hypothetical protein [Picosynechococcus sp. PCC 7117]|uniref:hypothetical protein n=1 Tax=Picosynechococcus sp. PCC 7117 TaxID=195498 RepID=UPI0008107820|nr:hypothetical protein [Picosynechococcus sp. PCC 7117]ANV87175.1 hypothetical protein AWQ22_06690 [Picosynechococcus sp. PCC 7117]